MGEAGTMTTIETQLGAIRGRDTDVPGGGSVTEFRGIRYAEAPVGEMRFRPPVRTGPWEGTLEATSFGGRSLQAPQPEIMGGPGPGEPVEDCLFLNVTTPAADDARRPVLCWIHGGAFTIGSGNDYPAAALAGRNDLVVVTVNYRLGLLGFLDLSDLDDSYAGSGNNGIADQVAALEWIRDNIADYGGDPGNVTIAGESAGAMSVMALLASPAADGLYAKAMANSAGGFRARGDDDRLETVGAALPGDGAVLSRLLDASGDQLLVAQAALGLGIGPSVDGVVLTRTQEEAVADRSRAGVPLLIGSNADEGTLFYGVAGMDADVFEYMTSFLHGPVTKGGDVEAYRRALADAYPDEDGVATNLRIWNQFFRRPAVESAEVATAAGAGGWLYRFDLPSTAFGGALKACHAGEIAFTFDWFAGDGDMPGWTFHDRTDATRSLAQRWSATVAAFCRTGDPNGAGLPEWPRYSSDDRSVLVLDEPVRIEVDPDETDRKLWNEL